uniref:Uncharacterized protein n=1 Tax=Clastoptera arizonana TaxID=38151 RepID=A0A1B6CBE0_9HEMI
MLVLLEDLEVLREFPIRMCPQAAFSSSGHLFAAANSTVIQIYSSISFHCIYNLKGHNNKITSLIWSASDKSLYSCGTDGALYEWNMNEGTRIVDVITKKCAYTDVAVTKDAKMVYGVGSDGLLKEICNAEILREENLLNHSYLHAIALSRSDLMMFVAGKRGAIISVRYPLPRPPEAVEYYLHKLPVTHLRLTYNDLNLISCSSDGSLCIWRLLNVERKAIKMDSEFKYSNEILINRDDLADKTAMIYYLENFVKSLETDHAYQVKEMNTDHLEKTKELHTVYCATIQDLKDKNQELLADHVIEVNRLHDNTAQMKKEHNNLMKNLESNYNAKLIVEYDKYAELENRSSAMREDLLKDIALLEQSKANALKEMAKDYDEKLHEKDNTIAELHKLQKQNEAEHEEIKQQIEYDADQEIIELKSHYEKLLITERDTNIRLRGESGVMKKKFIASQKEVDELKHKLLTVQNEQQQLRSLILGLKQDIDNLKREISERDSVIQENERKFSEIKNKNNELEKYKFVLNYKILGLKNEIQPKDDDIRLKKEQIEDMKEEILTQQKEITKLELHISEYRDKINDQEKENHKEKAVNRDLQSYIKRMCVDIHDAAQTIQDPLTLKKLVVKIYHQYCGGKEFKHGRQQDEEALSDFIRQRDYLEGTVASLKALLKKESSKKTGHEKLIRDNMLLIEEINDLRKELKLAQRQISDLQSITGLKKFVSAKEAQKKLQLAVKTREDIYQEYEDQLKESQRRIDTLEEEVSKGLGKHKMKKDTNENATQTLFTEPESVFDSYIGQLPSNYVLDEFEDT